MLTIRLAQVKDIKIFISLLDEYMMELFKKNTTLDIDTCLKDGFGKCFNVILAEKSDEVIGFGVWEKTYDIHWGIKGGNILDLFVKKEHRGFGVAVQILIAIANEVQMDGGLFLKGMAVDDERVSKLYKRLAIGFKGEDCIIGGKAFKKLSELRGKTAIDIIRNLPKKEWNYEA